MMHRKCRMVSILLAGFKPSCPRSKDQALASAADPHRCPKLAQPAGRVRVGTLAGFASETWPASDRNSHGAHRKHRLAAIKRLDLRLFIDAQHDSTGWWRHVKADNIAHLVDKIIQPQREFPACIRRVHPGSIFHRRQPAKSRVRTALVIVPPTGLDLGSGIGQ